MNELIKLIFECATIGIIKGQTLKSILDEVETAIQERDLSLNVESGELWQQLQDFREAQQ